jgi:elongation factor P
MQTIVPAHRGDGRGASAMANAADLRMGMIVQVQDQMYRVLAAEYRAGGGKMPGAVHAKLQDVLTGSITDRRLRPEEKVTTVTVERETMEFLYQDGDAFYFMKPTTFEQLPVPRQVLGAKAGFLQPGVRVPVETIGERAIGVVFPESLDLRVASTAQPMHQRETSALKRGVLENGMEVLVPLFIKEGELIRIEVATGKYLERVKESGKR